MATWTKITIWLKRNYWDVFFVLIFLSLDIFISFKNYTPGTWLTGWDNLHPEFNFYLNIKRSIFAVWQEYQGLGLLGGMGHAADLPRQVILWGLGYIIPVEFLRYFWTFLMLTIGPIGVYFLVSKKLISEDNGFLAKISGLTAGMFYLFNLATLQTFYTPFETFTAFYGFIPGLLYFAVSYLKSGKSTGLFKYFLFAAVAGCAFYVQTLFVVWTIFLTIIAFETVLTSPKNGFVLSIKLALTTLFVNAFWLLPVVYFAIVGWSTPGASHINSIATPETQIMNQARGTFQDIGMLKGYWFDYFDWDSTGNYDYLYRDWIDYLGKPYVSNVGMAIFYVALVGLLLAIFKKKITYRFSFLVLGLISYFMLAGVNPPFGKWFDLVVKTVPLFGEIFRNSFTKWGTAASLIYSIGLGYFVYIIADLFKSKFKYFLVFLLSGIIISGSIFVVLPFFEGKLISKSMRVDIPQDYFDLFKFFSTQDKTKRIANFPQLNFWGWNFDKWVVPAGRQGYKGSGFVWYGIEQPILDRAFDVWSPHNENFYKEANYAITYGTTADFEGVLSKYQISYILFDESIYDPGNPSFNILVQKQKEILESSKLITKNKSFGKITIYDVNLNSNVHAFISGPGNFPAGVPLATVKDSDLPAPKNLPSIAETFPNLQGYLTSKNCDLEARGIVTKQSTDGGNKYTASGGGVSCDYFYYPTIDYSKTYVMHLVGENVSGRSLKFYLFNVKSGTIDKEELLPRGIFDNYYLVLPTGKGNKMGYTLNVETRSYGNVASENKLQKIEFYPVDESYLNTFKDTVLHGGYSNMQGQSLLGTEKNDILIKNVQKQGTWLYKIDVQNWGLIQLGQGYDTGWIAMPTWNYHLPVINYQIELPDFSKRLEHVKVSDWSNGWTVDSSDCSQMENGNCQMIIVFWPQLLEWGGAVLGVIGLIVLASKLKKIPHSS